MSESENGLRVSNDILRYISYNIANASTIGYKSSQPVFFDIFSTSLHSTRTFGNGVGISKVIQNFNNGTLMPTNRDLDIGISNEGFFRVLDSEGHIHYTRNGQFILDSNKNIVNMQGMYLTGCNQESLKNVFNAPTSEAINLKDAYILKAEPTTEIRLKMIFNNQENNIPKTNDNNNTLTNLETNTNSLFIYKKNGEEEKINISFNKLENNKWQVHIQSDNTENKNGIDSTFELQFNSNGKLTSDANVNIKSKNSEYNDINLNLTDTIEQSGTPSVFEKCIQNGRAESKLKMFNISPNGEIIGTYDNHTTPKVIGQILLSKFVSPEKLHPENGSLWSATAESGREIIGIAGHDGFGSVISGTLEMSNVDLNKELINMIVAQRNYQSNAQAFKAEDKMINTLINLH